MFEGNEKVKVHEITEALNSLSQDIDMFYSEDDESKQKAFLEVMSLIERETTYSEQVNKVQFEMMDLS